MTDYIIIKVYLSTFKNIFKVKLHIKYLHIICNNEKYILFQNILIVKITFFLQSNNKMHQSMLVIFKYGYFQCNKFFN